VALLVPLAAAAVWTEGWGVGGRVLMGGDQGFVLRPQQGRNLADTRSHTLTLTQSDIHSHTHTLTQSDTHSHTHTPRDTPTYKGGD